MTASEPGNIVDARDIPPLTREQTDQLAYGELDGFVRLLDQIEGADWDRPTACDLWSVRDVVAHQGGHVQAGMGLRGMISQLNPKLAKPFKKRGMNTLDAMNEAQVEMRREWSIEELVGEVRARTPEAIVSRRGMRWPARLVRVPAPDYGLIRVDYLLHVVFPRDMWIHRLDIADATGRPFSMTVEHDGLMLEHVVRDMDRIIRKRLPGQSIRLTVDGPAGGTWKLGRGDETEVTMDILDFMRASSGRLALARRLEVAEVSTADAALKERVLGSLAAVY
ncbi:MAG: maleylpyruvate isomerase family mycothiol-dependent enzyme [Chloroflexi bacterium]|nr:maleylpyruvate isomerase family mycothiol-dependent enzyme [Chloroflexota bacterium]